MVSFLLEMKWSTENGSDEVSESETNLLAIIDKLQYNLAVYRWLLLTHHLCASRIIILLHTCMEVS